MNLSLIFLLLTLASCVQTTRELEQDISKKNIEQNRRAPENLTTSDGDDFRNQKDQEEADQKFNQNGNPVEYTPEEKEFNQNTPTSFFGL